MRIGSTLFCIVTLSHCHRLLFLNSRHPYDLTDFTDNSAAVAQETQRLVAVFYQAYFSQSEDPCAVGLFDHVDQFATVNVPCFSTMPLGFFFLSLFEEGEVVGSVATQRTVDCLARHQSEWRLENHFEVDTRLGGWKALKGLGEHLVENFAHTLWLAFTS